MSFLLDIPTKKTDEVNLTKPLNNYLLSIYGNTSEYQADLNILDKLRLDLRGSNPDMTGIKMYYKYYSQIELLDLRIPFATVNKHKKIDFTWYDVFNSGLVHSQNALAFEKANILFNLGALLSKVAVARFKEDKSPELIQLFLQSAGIFQFLNENFLHAPSVDLSQSTVKFLGKLMLAQLQEVFLLKVISSDLEQKKNSLISKLSRSAADHYEVCFGMVSHLSGSIEETEEDLEELEPIKESETRVNALLDVSWLAVIHLKLQYFSALANYYNGLHLESTRKYGTALAYITKSRDILNDITPTTLKSVAQSSSNDVYELLDGLKFQKDAIGIKLAGLDKDNDLIYNEIVPSLVTLPEVKPMDSTKIIPINENKLFQEINDYNYGNFLNNVIPINIHELLSFYSEEKSQFLRNEIDLVDVSNEELSSILEFLELPQKLIQIKQVLTKEVEGPDSIISEKADEMAAKFGTDASNKEKIAKLRRQIYETVTATESFGAPKEDTLKIKKSLYDASALDTKLFDLVDLSFYSLVAKGLDSTEFKNLFSAAPVIAEVNLLDFESPKSNNLDDSISNIQNLLSDLNNLRTTKTKLIETLKKEIHDDEISDILILNSRIKSTNEIKSVIFPAELKKFEPYNLELDKLLTKQRELIEQVKTSWSGLVGNSEVKRLQNANLKLTNLLSTSLKKVLDLYEKWGKYTVGLSRGVDFYTKLLQYSVGLKMKYERENVTDKFGQMNLGQPSGQQNLGPAVPGKVQVNQGNPNQGNPNQGNPNQTIPNQTNPQYLGQAANPQYRPQVNQYMGQQIQQPQHLGQQPQQQQPQYQGNPQLQPNQPNQQFQGNPPDNGNNLIYDQPSTYNPNMYDFFGK